MVETLIQFGDDEDAIFVEVKRPPEFERASSSQDGIVEKATMSFDTSLQKLRPMIQKIRQALDVTGPDEIEVEFGINIGTEVGAFVASGSVDVNYKVKLKWVPKKPDAAKTSDQTSSSQAKSE